MDEKSVNEQIADRRDALGWSQEDLAARVRAVSGKPFSQQSLNKLEKPGANSRFLHYVLEVLRRGELGEHAPQQPPVTTPTYIDQLRQAAIALINTADAATLLQIMSMATPGAQIATANQQAPPNGSIMDVVESHAIDEEKFFSAIRSVVRDEVKSVIVDLDEKREERRMKDFGRSPTGQMRRKTDKK